MTRTIVVLVAGALLSACSSMSMRSPAATAVLVPTKGNQASGTVNFTQKKGNIVLVEAKVSGLTPGAHGFHVHEKGNCTAPDASSAGGHFNPGGAPHGGPGHSPQHAGDLGNLEADASGLAIYKAEITGISLGTGDDSIIGRAVIVHEKPDDLSTQPSGGSGPRIACGLISKSPDKWF